MKLTDTISVNPGKTALGHTDAASALFRNPVLGNQSARTFDAMALIFPSSAAGTSEFRKYSVPLRTLFATILLVTGITALSMPFGPYSVAFAVCSLAFGAFLGLGFLTRPVMAGAAVYYCICGALSLRAGAPDITTFSLMFGCAIFCVVGAGKYSCDTLIRRAIRRHIAAGEKKRKENTLGYKAFHSVRY